MRRAKFHRITIMEREVDIMLNRIKFHGIILLFV